MKATFQSIICAVLVVLFIYASLGKLLDYEEFRGQLHNQSFSHQLADFLVYALPLTELLTAILLLYTPTQKAGLLLSAVLMTIFTGYIVLVLLHYWSRVPCSCGGILSHMSWTTHLLFNCFFLMLTVVGLLLSRQRTQERGTQAAIKELR